MKKIAAFFLLVAVVFAFAGCKDAPATVPAAKTTLPKVIDELFDRYVGVIADCGFDLELLKDGKLSKTQTYIFDVRSKNIYPNIYPYESESLYLSVTENENIKSINICVDVTGTAALKELIVATLMALNIDMNCEEATGIMQSLVNSYSDEAGYSDFLEINGVVYTLIYYSDSEIEFQATAKDYVWRQINADEYQEVDYAAYMAAKMHIGMNVFFEGTVKDYRTRKKPFTGPFATAIIESTDEYLYTGIVYYRYRPVKLEKGKKYRFYGNISMDVDNDDETFIAIHYAEPIE